MRAQVGTTAPWTDVGKSSLICPQPSTPRPGDMIRWPFPNPGDELDGELRGDPCCHPQFNPFRNQGNQIEQSQPRARTGRPIQNTIVRGACFRQSLCQNHVVPKYSPLFSAHFGALEVLASHAVSTTHASDLAPSRLHFPASPVPPENSQDILADKNVESIIARCQISDVPYHKTQMRTILVKKNLSQPSMSMCWPGSSSLRPPIDLPSCCTWVWT